MALGDIVLLKDQTPRGPFTRAQIQDGLSRGEFTPRDLAHAPGLKDWLPLLEVLHHLDREVVTPPRSRGTRNLPPLPSAGDSSPSSNLSNAGEASGDQPSFSILPPLPSSLFGAEKTGPSPEDLATSLPVISQPLPPSLPSSIKPPELPPADRAPAAQPPRLPMVTPSLPVAPFGRRAMASLIDCAILFLPVLAFFGIGYVIWWLQGTWEHKDSETLRQEKEMLWNRLRELLLLVAVGFAWLYAAGLESSRWQGTVGKLWMGLTVTDAFGKRIGFLRASGRHLAKYLSAVPLFIGFMAALFDSQGRAWHDRLAETRVLSN